MLDARIVIGRGDQRVVIPCHELRQDNVADHILGYMRMNESVRVMSKTMQPPTARYLRGSLARQLRADLGA